MKKLPIILSSVAFVIAIAAAVLTIVPCSKCGAKAETEVSAEAAPAGSIVYFRLDQVIAEYDMANEQRSVLETKANGIQQDLDRRTQKLQKDVNDFQTKYQKGLMTTAVAQQQGQALQQREQELAQFVQQKEAEMQEEQIVFMNTISDAIQTFVEKYNAEKGYAMILASTAGQPVITAAAALDVTEEIIAGLNAEYVSAKGKK